MMCIYEDQQQQLRNWPMMFCFPQQYRIVTHIELHIPLFLSSNDFLVYPI